MRFASRIGLAVVKPRAAFAVAGDRRYAGRSGSDLLLAIVILLAATQLRWLVSAVWLGAAVNVGLGLSAFVHVLTQTLMLDLAVLVIAAGIIWFAGGPRRELGRSFDLACVAALPLVLLHGVAQIAADTLSLPTPVAVRWVVECVAFGWMAGLVTLAIFANRRAEAPALEARARSHGMAAGWVLAGLAVFGFAGQLRWIAGNVDQMRPLVAGATAPPLDLPAIGANGALEQHVSLAPGRITIIDFWATWCGPCLRAMPRLDAFARKHPEVDVIAINLDDAVEARGIFDKARFVLKLLADDGATSERYGVTAIPHTVVIDRQGTLRKVGRGGGLDLEAEVDALAR